MISLRIVIIPFLFWIFPNPYTNSYAYAVLQSRLKYTVIDSERYLFNLDMDQTESNNLIGVYPVQADQMEMEYIKLVGNDRIGSE